MLKLLLDEHISPDIALALRRLTHRFVVNSIHDWEGGHFIGAPDHELLQEAARHGFTLVTFDLKTIPMVLRLWGEQGIPHGGVIFIDETTLAQNDIGGISRTLRDLWRANGKLDWTNRVVFLQKNRAG